MESVAVMSAVLPAPADAAASAERVIFTPPRDVRFRLKKPQQIGARTVRRQCAARRRKQNSRRGCKSMFAPPAPPLSAVYIHQDSLPGRPFLSTKGILPVPAEERNGFLTRITVPLSADGEQLNLVRKYVFECSGEDGYLTVLSKKNTAKQRALATYKTVYEYC
jgi:hypothetical protein